MASRKEEEALQGKEEPSSTGQLRNVRESGGQLCPHTYRYKAYVHVHVYVDKELW